MRYAFVINYNRLTYTRQMADYLSTVNGIDRLLIVDNDSDYPPLLKYYETTRHEVLVLKENMGSSAVWHSGVLDYYEIHGNFIVTDPDIDATSLPKDWVNELQIGLDRYPDILKAGIGLRIDDLPDTPLAEKARAWEKPHWAYPLDNERFFRASTSTTLCLCRNRTHDYPSVRTGPPYVAKHLPWYYACKDDIPEDELYYMDKIGDKWNYWTKMMRDSEEDLIVEA